jgi:hypothetical protein
MTTRIQLPAHPRITTIASSKMLSTICHGTSTDHTLCHTYRHANLISTPSIPLMPFSLLNSYIAHQVLPSLLRHTVQFSMSDFTRCTRLQYGRAESISKAPTRRRSEADTAHTPAISVCSAGEGQLGLQSLQIAAIKSVAILW